MKIGRALSTIPTLALALLAARPSLAAQDPCQVIAGDFASFGSTAMEQVVAAAPVKYHDIATSITLQAADPDGVLMPQAGIDNKGRRIIEMSPDFGRVACELMLSSYLTESRTGFDPEAERAARCLEDRGTSRQCFSAYADSLWKRKRAGYEALKKNTQDALIANYFYCVNQILMHEAAHLYRNHAAQIANKTIGQVGAEFDADFFAMTSGATNGYMIDGIALFFSPLAAVEDHLAKRDVKKYESAQCRLGNIRDISAVVGMAPTYLTNGPHGGSGLLTLDEKTFRQALQEQFSKPAPALDHLQGCGFIAKGTLSTAYVELKSLSLRMAAESRLLFAKDQDLDVGRADLLLRDLATMAGEFKQMNGLAAESLSHLVLAWKLNHDGKAFAEQVDRLLAVPGASDNMSSTAYGRLLQVEGLVILQERTDLVPEVRLQRSAQLLRAATHYYPGLAEGWANLAFIALKRGHCVAADHFMERSLATTSETGHNLDVIKRLGSWIKGLAQDPAKCKAESAKFHVYPGL